MEVNNKPQNTGNKTNKNNQKGYYRKTRSKHTGGQTKEEVVPPRISNNTKTFKAKKPAEETIADIIYDIERIEKEIELEIMEIQSAKLSF